MVLYIEIHKLCVGEFLSIIDYYNMCIAFKIKNNKNVYKNFALKKIKKKLECMWNDVDQLLKYGCVLSGSQLLQIFDYNIFLDENDNEIIKGDLDFYTIINMGEIASYMLNNGFKKVTIQNMTYHINENNIKPLDYTILSISSYIKNGVIFQIMNINAPTPVDYIMKKFDFSVCKNVLYYTKNGLDFLCNDLEAIVTKKITVNLDVIYFFQTFNEHDTKRYESRVYREIINRYEKYASRGYEINYINIDKHIDLLIKKCNPYAVGRCKLCRILNYDLKEYKDCMVVGNYTM